MSDKPRALGRAEAWIVMMMSGALAGACSFDNPKFGDDTGASASSSSSSSTSTSTGSTSTSTASSTSTTTTSTSTSAASGESEGVTTTTDATSSTTGDSSTTGAEGRCPGGTERVVLATAVADTMVVKPSADETCAWNVACATANYGNAGYVDMFNDPLDGTSLFLVRFDLVGAEQILLSAGIDPAEVLGYYLRIVFWEDIGAPEAERSFAVATIAEANETWRAGAKSGEAAGEGDSSYLCRSIDAGQCVPWDGLEGPLSGATPVATIDLTAAAAMVGEEENPDDPTQFHAHIASARIDPAVIEPWLGAPTNPGFVVSLIEHKQRSVPNSLGLKPFEAMPWSDPTLFVERCVPIDEGTGP